MQLHHRANMNILRLVPVTFRISFAAFVVQRTLWHAIVQPGPSIPRRDLKWKSVSTTPVTLGRRSVTTEGESEGQMVKVGTDDNAARYQRQSFDKNRRLVRLNG